MSTPFRLGIVGAGRITQISHLPAALAAREVRLVGLVDPERERAKRLLADTRSDAAALAELGELLPDVDGVVIATPNFTHTDLVLACLRAGVHVLVEKPLANTVAEGEQLAEAAAKSGCVVAVGYCTRFLASVQLMRRLLENGYFGAVRSFAYQQGAAGGWASASGFHLERSMAGGGVLVTLGTHFLERMLHWFGQPESCELLDDSTGGPEANALARFSYGGFAGSARFSRTVALRAGFVMQTQRGVVLLRESATEPIRFRPAELPDVEARLEAEHAAATDSGGASGDVFALQLSNFVAACRGVHEPRVTLRDGIDAIRLVSDLYAHRTQLACDWYRGVE